MTYALRPYQQEARYQINALLNGGRSPLFVSCTGSGKTKTSVQVIADQATMNRRLYVTVPQLEIFDQWLQDLTAAGLDPGMINDKGIKGRDKAVYVCMIDSLNNQLQFIPEAIYPDIIVDDEAHLAAAPKYRRVHCAFPDARRYGMTGSPYRYDNKPLGDIFTDIVQTIEMYECQANEWLAKTLIVVPEKHYSKMQIPRSGEEFDMMAQADLLGKTEIIGDFIEDYGDIYAGKPVMVACCTTEHAAQVRDQFNAAGWNFAHLHATLPRHERRKIIRQIRAEEINGVTTVGVGVLGLDIPGLYGVMWLTRTMSLTRWMQFCVDDQTEILTQKGWRTIDTINKNDLAAGFNMETNEIKYVPIIRIIKRKIYDQESFFGIESPHLSARVTESHDMICASRRHGKWKKVKAKNMGKKPSLYKVPVAGNMNIPDCQEIKDCEIEFLGWFLSDGTRDKRSNVITISQSQKHALYVMEIENILKKCGFKYGKNRIKRTGEYASYQDSVMFRVSYGKLKGRDKHLKGYDYLSEWCDKSIPEIYNKLSRRQFRLLVGTIFKGDGFKKSKADYNPQTQTITFGDNLRMAERIQELALLRGYSAKISIQKTPTAFGKSYNLFLRNNTYRTIAGLNDRDGSIKGKKPYKRARFEELGKTGIERVWCIENEFGTIVTRRNGKPLIMGNCGRGLRAFPGKTHGVIYDPVGNTFLHGAPEMVRAWTLDGEYRPTDTDEVPVMRVCPFCGVMNAYDNRMCHFCGKPIADEDGERPRICLFCRHYIELLGKPDCTEGAFNPRWLEENGCKVFEKRGRALPAIVDGELVVVEGDGQAEDIRKRSEDMKARQQADEDKRRKQEEREEIDGGRAGLTPGERADVLKRGLFDGRRKLWKESIESFL